MDEDTCWRFRGFATDIDGNPTVRLYAHIEYGYCYAVVAEDDRLDHQRWCESVVTR
jgi:hypothetical protein